MNKAELKSLGITEKDVLEKLVDKLSQEYYGDDEGYRAEFGRKLDEAVKKRVDEHLNKGLTKHVLPKISEMVEGLCLEETNRWGEKRGTKLTFIEYLVQRADAYIREEVDYKGNPKGTDSYSWSAKGTRIAHMINEHLHYSISRAMEKALGEVNSSARKGLEEAVNMALKSIHVTVETKVKS